MRRLFYQGAGIGVLSLIGWGVDLVPSNTSWIPSGIIWSIAFIWLVVILINLLKNRKQPRQRNEAKTVVKNGVQLDLVKLFHDGKDIQAKLKSVQSQWSVNEQVTTELYFEAWFEKVSNTLKNTEFLNLWYENKVVNYRKDSISDYIGASERALDRLKSIIKLSADVEAHVDNLSHELSGDKHV